MKTIRIATLLAFCLLASHAGAAEKKFPKATPAFSVTIPDAWKPKEEGNWLECNSDDGKGSVYFQVAESKDGFDKIIQEFIVWLQKENQVAVKIDSPVTGEMKLGDLEWKTIAYDAKSKDFGPAKVGFLMCPLETGKVVVVTFWITKDGGDKCVEILKEKILPSLKAVK